MRLKVPTVSSLPWFSSHYFLVTGGYGAQDLAGGRGVREMYVDRGRGYYRTRGQPYISALPVDC